MLSVSDKLVQYELKSLESCRLDGDNSGYGTIGGTLPGISEDRSTYARKTAP